MSKWIRLRGVDVDKIIDWCRESEVTYSIHNPVFKLGSRDYDYDWRIDDEKERTMFILRWRQ